MFSGQWKRGAKNYKVILVAAPRKKSLALGLLEIRIFGNDLKDLWVER